MSKHLIRAIKYCVISFISTHHALAAEKILKDTELAFILIPTPKEISTSCGLSVKLSCSDTKTALDILAKQQITQVMAYQVNKETGQQVVTKL
ncbi:MAG: DUF3343 domain-containing protein [Clostridia bacterium]|nr:DUF3343 domain-containing protein [Clostridia bacterium]